jgi:hypothetical protein
MIGHEAREFVNDTHWKETSLEGGTGCAHGANLLFAVLKKRSEGCV